jgi:predicted AAA+ superfamily ATPase
VHYERTLSAVIKRASETFPVVLVSGPRQVGKTTIFRQALEKPRTYVSLDDPTVRSIARRDPALFFKTYTPPLLIDEVQYAPELFPHIKMIADERGSNGLIWLTGSQMFHLMENVAESLAGRVAILNMEGLSQGEKLRRPNGPPFLPAIEMRSGEFTADLLKMYGLMWEGSYLRLLADKRMNWSLFYSSYVSTYVERDIRAGANITREHEFLQFMKVIAARTGQLLNYSDMAKDVEISVNTVKSWVSILETSGLIYLLHPYANNLTSRTVKTPKIYFFDSGLVCYLTGWDSPGALANGAMSGAILEMYAIAEIIKSYWHNGERERMYFYRDRNGREIDLIIERNGALHPVEIKRMATPSVNDAKHFEVLKSFRREIGMGAIICLRDSPIPLDSNVIAVPLSSL